MSGLLLDRQALTQLSTLIDLIYEGATDLQVWPQVPEAISRWMNAPRCTLFTPAHTPADGGFMMAHNLSPLAIEMWATKYQLLDLWAQRAQDRGQAITGHAFRDQDLATEEELVATEMYRDFFAPMNVGRLACGVVFGLDSSTQMPVVCSCNRSLREPFLADDLFKLQLLLPHLSRALGVMFRLREADFKLASTLAALDKLKQAIVLFSRSGGVFHANSAAQELFKQNDGLSLVNLGKPMAPARLRAADRVQQARLDSSLSAALHPDPLIAEHFAVALTISRPSGLPAYALHFSLLPSSNDFGQGAHAPAAIAFIDTGTTTVTANPKVLKQRYDLGEAELRVTQLAAEGLSVETLAEELGISTNTVKTHLKRIYFKTGAKSRSQLVKLVMASQALA